jgi:hypothetical protein
LISSKSSNSKWTYALTETMVIGTNIKACINLSLCYSFLLISKNSFFIFEIMHSLARSLNPSLRC